MLAAQRSAAGTPSCWADGRHAQQCNRGQASVTFTPPGGSPEVQSWIAKPKEAVTKIWDISSKGLYSLHIRWDLTLQVPAQHYSQGANYTFDSGPCLDRSAFSFRSVAREEKT